MEEIKNTIKSKKNKNNNIKQLRTPLGTHDLTTSDIQIREYIFNIAKKCFTSRNAEQLETPVIEQYNIVKNIYGQEFKKLVYKIPKTNSIDLETSSEDDDDLILRYDLTVPFARYVGMNGLKVFRRFQIGKVYRKDYPQISHGRYREFYQCDFDIAGSDENTGIYDLEVLELANDLLKKLLNNNFIIKLNHRQIIFEYLKNMSFEESSFNKISTILDKLGKKPQSEIFEELATISTNKDNIDNIKKFIDEIINMNKLNKSAHNIIQFLEENKFVSKPTLNIIANILNGIKELNFDNKIIFDPLLARGLDYYTGIIFESFYYDNKKTNNIISSSICAGGRYDNLIGKFSNLKSIPAVGLSLGVERIVGILEIIYKNKFKKNNNSPQIYVCSIGDNMILERIKLCSIFRQNNIIAQMSHQSNPKMRKQFDYVFQNNIPYMIVIGNEEIKNKKIKIKIINKKEELTFDREEGIKYLIENCNKI